MYHHLTMYQHMRDRHFKPWLYLNSVVISSDVLTFYLWNLSGQLVGYQQYRPDGNKLERRNPREGKYFTYTSKHYPLAAWGLELLNPKSRVIYLVEGVFKACRFHNYGMNALAVLGNNPKHLRSWLRSLGYHIHVVCDGDAAGKKLAKYGDSVTYMPIGKQIDEITKEEFKDLIINLTEK